LDRVFAQADFANRGGGPLDDSDSDDDEYERERVLSLRAQAAALRRAHPQVAIADRRRRGRTASDEPDVLGAISSIRDGVRDAAMQVQHMTGAVGVIVQSRAAQIRRYLSRKIRDARRAQDMPGARATLRQAASRRQAKSPSLLGNLTGGGGGGPSGVDNSERVPLQLEQPLLLRIASMTDARTLAASTHGTGTRRASDGNVGPSLSRASRSISVASRLSVSSSDEAAPHEDLLLPGGGALPSRRARTLSASLTEDRIFRDDFDKGAITPIDLGQWGAGVGSSSADRSIAQKHPAAASAAAIGAQDDYVELQGASPRASPHTPPTGTPPPAMVAAAAATSSSKPPASSVRRASKQAVRATAASSPTPAVAASPLDQEDGVEGSPVAVCFPELWRAKEERLRRASPYSSHPGWRLVPVIVKANDDLRQEQFASQLIGVCARICRVSRVPVWLRPYDILATERQGGFISAIPDTISLDSLRKGTRGFTSLNNWFISHFRWGADGDRRLHDARSNFVSSMAGYAAVCYLLNIKDRHNGNILLTRRGHVIHIDYGFMLTSSPGREFARRTLP
jgi:hypothetical protein